MNNSKNLHLEINLIKEKGKKSKDKKIEKEEVKENEKINIKSFVDLALFGTGSSGDVYLAQKIGTKHNYSIKY